MSAKRTKEKSESVEVIAYKFIGYPDEETAETLTSFCNACRYMWNRFLADSLYFYKTIGGSLHPRPADYKDIEGLEWLNSVDSLALANVQMNFESAMEAFFDNRSGYPNFKKKRFCKMSYKTNLSNKQHPNLYLENEMLKLPKVKAPIRLNIRRKIRQGGVLKNCTVSLEHGKWFFSLLFEYPKTQYQLPDIDTEDFSHIGLDMFLPKLFVDSNGNSPEFIKAYAAAEKKLAKEQRKLSHMKGAKKREAQSNNYKKQKERVARLHAKIKHQRQDMLHKLSAYLTDKYDLISVEDLDMSAMKKAMTFGKSVSDNGWGMFVQMLEYKQKKKGHVLIKVSKWYPSSKLCSHCGYIHKDLDLEDRMYVCPECGHIMNRDRQAAINIDREGMQLYREMIRNAA